MHPPPTSPTRVLTYNRGPGCVVAGRSGVIAAGLTAGAPIWALTVGAQTSQANPSLRFNAYLDKLRIAWTTVAAFTTSVTAGRALQLVRFSGVTALAGGTTMTVARKDADPGSFTASGSAMIATTGAITLTGGSPVAGPLDEVDLVHVGGAGARAERLLELAAPANYEIVLRPGETIALVAGPTFDAGGTGQITVSAEWCEAMRADVLLAG